MKKYILSIGNVYIDINFIGTDTAGATSFQAGKEYIADGFSVVPGGSIVNFTTQLNKFGTKVGLIGKVGADELGLKFKELLEREGIATNLLITSPSVSTCISVGSTLKTNGDNVQIVSGNANQSLCFSDIDLDNPFLQQVDGIYLGGFVKQKSLFMDYPKLLKIFSDRGIKLFLDHGRIPSSFSPEQTKVLLDSLKYIEVYFANKDEILDIAKTDSVDQALKTVLTYGPKIVVAKLGSDGCHIKTATEDFIVPGYKIEVVNTVGAGDTFNAGFINYFQQSKSLRQCAIFANATAALKITKNTQPTLDEVEQYIASNAN